MRQILNEPLLILGFLILTHHNFSCIAYLHYKVQFVKKTSHCPFSLYASCRLCYATVQQLNIFFDIQCIEYHQHLWLQLFVKRYNVIKKEKKKEKEVIQRLKPKLVLPVN